MERPLGESVRTSGWLPRQKALAGGAEAAGALLRLRFAEERLREQPRERLFAAAARAAEKIGMHKAPGARRTQKMLDLRAVALKSLDFKPRKTPFHRADPKAAGTAAPPLPDQILTNFSTLRTNTVAPPTTTSIG